MPDIKVPDIKLLDCTLRDGGNVNNCLFDTYTPHIIQGLVDAGLDIVEVGFIRDVEYDPRKTIYTKAEDSYNILKDIDRKQALFSVLVEAKEDVTKQFPIAKMKYTDQSGLDLIRVCIWERLMEDHLEYCRMVKDYGYNITIQPTAVAHYTDEKFIRLCEAANEIQPFALYLVDTFGTQSSTQIMHLSELADKHLDKNIRLGYHGHNNKMQALACAESFLRMGMDRGLNLDGSIGGMGKGPGNLQTEVIMDDLNEMYGMNFDVEKICILYEKYIKEFYKEDFWGYSMYHFIGSREIATQYYASYFMEKDYGEETFIKFLKGMDILNKGRFSAQLVEDRLKELGLK